MSLRAVTVGLAVFLLFAAKTMRHALAGPLERAAPEFAKGQPWHRLSKRLFSAPAAVILLLLLFAEVPKNYLTIALALEGAGLMALGFPFRDRFLRFTGLGVLGVAIVKVFVDLLLRDIDTVYKVIACIGLGGLLIAIGLLYARFRETINKVLKD